MKNFGFWQPTLFTTAIYFLLAGTARADGPFVASFFPHSSPATCQPIKRSKNCQRTDISWTVNKADGSGTTTVAVIEDKSLSYSTIAKTASTLGEPYFSKTDSYAKQTLAKRAYRGLILEEEGKIIEPAIYPLIFPISDKVGLAMANEESRFYGKSNPAYTETNKFYLVDLDGKLTKPKSKGLKPYSFYFIGGYGMTPVNVFAATTRDDARGTITIEQYDGYGNVRAVFDNFVPAQKKNYNDGYERSFAIDRMTGNFTAAALHPDTGKPASIRFAPDGSLLGYGPPVVVRGVLTDTASKSREWDLLTVVGKLPVLTKLKDETLYHPVDDAGEKIAAPQNFIGMARMFAIRGDGSVADADNYYYNWLLVYALPTGYGYKVARRASSQRYPVMSAMSAHNVLAAEREFKMFSGFGHSGSDTIIRPFDNYEADGVTPTKRALPTKWHQIFTNGEGELTLLADSDAQISKTGFATSTEAFVTLESERVASAQEYARRLEIRRQQSAALEASQRAESERRHAELQAHFAQEAQKQAAIAHQEKYRRKTGAEEFSERMKLMENHWNRQNKPNLPSGTKVCYDMGDGSDFCFAY